MNGTKTTHVWDGSNIVMELDGSDNILDKYIRGINLIKNNFSYFLFNAHGDVVHLTDSAGAVTKRYHYDAFGNEVSPSASDGNPWRYCGEYFDSSSGTYYLRNRYYDPATSRMLSEDPVRSGLNWYTYCSNNPIAFIDPFGLEEVYIFYGVKHGENGGFDDRAKAEAKYWEKQGYTVYIKAITTEDEFSSEWAAMENNKSPIVNVSLYFHSNAQTLILDYTNDEYVTINSSGKTGSGADALRVEDLDYKRIQTMYLFACNSGHQDYKNENLAYSFISTQGIINVFAWDGSMRWGYFDGKPKLASSQNYFEGHLIDQQNKRKPYGLVKYSIPTKVVGDPKNPNITIIGKWDNR